MAVFTFDYSAWVARFPEFASVSSPLATLYFGEASMLLDNTDASPVPDASQRGVLLNLITSHIAKLAASDLVGRISQATEGSVSASAEYAAPDTGTMAYWDQTKYGAQYWAMTAPLRTMQYVAVPHRRWGC
jgi:hypothetical protein